MRKSTLTALVTLAAILVAAAVAGATQVHHPVPIKTARRMVARYERQRWHRHASVTGCARRSPAVAICTVQLIDLVIADGTDPISFTAKDEVTRSGPCSTPVVRRTGPGAGIAHGGGGRPRNCFTGPLVVIPVPDSLRQIG